MKYNIKAFKSPKDSRDIQLGKITIPEELPINYLPNHDDDLKILNQGQQPACSGYAGAILKTIADMFDTSKVNNYSARFLYACCKFIDGLPDVEGTYTRAIGKALKEYGICNEEFHESNIFLSKDDFKDYSKISNKAFENAQPRIIKSYAFVGTGIENIKQAIYKHEAVLVIIKPFFKGYEDGHFVVMDGWVGDRLRYINSFGKEWGDNGYGWWEEGTHQKLIEAMTIIDLPDRYVKLLTSQITLLKQLTALYLKLIKLKKVD
jgi:hypothetical protein